MRDTISQRSVAIPLVALAVSWAIFMVAIYTDLFVEQIIDDNGNWVGEDPAIKVSKYLFFVAVAVFASASIYAQRLAIKQRIEVGADERLPRSAHRFATLTIVIALVVGAILGISVFLEGFNTYGPRSDDLALRFFSTYLPILLYTALVVAGLLVGFVFRKDSLPKSDDKVSTRTGPVDLADQKPEATRSLGAAYALPIIAVAVALIFGLIVFDATGTTLQVWVWVIIQTLIGAGVVMGAIFAEQAVASGPIGHSSRSRITRGARSLNFVLSIVFGGVVTIMGFSYGASAVQSLQVSPSLYIEIMPAQDPTVNEIEAVANGWDLEEGSTVTLTLEDPRQEILRGTVGNLGDFYQSATLPQNLEPGEYLVEAEATAADGTPLSRVFRFAITETGAIDLKFSQANYPNYGQEESRIIDASWAWFFDDLLPAFVLILLAQLGVYFSITSRNRKTPAQ